VSGICKKLNAREIKIFNPELTDTIMQNVVVLADMARLKLIEGITPRHYIKAIKDLMEGEKLDKNIKLFNKVLQRSSLPA
jgi:Pyruvate/2-oxoacid:ferredoxin oxidoreductase gamma subunit